MTDTGSTSWLVHVQHRNTGSETLVFTSEGAARAAMAEEIRALCGEHDDSDVADSDVARLDFLREFGEGVWIEQSAVHG